MTVDNLVRRFADGLAPMRCHFCGARCSNSPACDACTRALPWNVSACRACAMPLPCGHAASVCAACLGDAPPQDRTWAAFRYEPPVSQAILDLKFHGVLAPAHVLGRLMLEHLARRSAPLPELLIPVPLHAGRLRRRGYNQAQELARELAAGLTLRLESRAARRQQATLEQTRLDAAGRRRNVHGAFVVDRARVEGRHVALLDDVITTGATLAELARTARAAGAARVEAWAAARVP